jgi:hypothetical protein
MPYRASWPRADTKDFANFSYQTGGSALNVIVDSRRSQSEAELLNSLRATVAHVDPLPTTARNRVRAAFVLAALERGLIGPGARREAPPPPPTDS